MPLPGRERRPWPVVAGSKIHAWRERLGGIPDHSIRYSQHGHVAASVRSLDRGGTAPTAGGHSPTSALNVRVSYDELAALREPAGDWLTYSGSYWSSRHSALTRINRTNVRGLALRWIYPFAGEVGDLEVSPVVRGGVMFVTQPPSRVLALDATTGKQIWAYDHK